MARSRATDDVALLHAAAAVFESRGYRNTTIDDIADAAGVSRPTVYRYTSSKIALLDRVIDTVCDDLTDSLAKVHEGSVPAPDRLRQIVRVHVASVTKLRSFYTIVFSEQAELSDYARDRFYRFSHETALDMRSLIDECLRLRPPGRGSIDSGIATNLVLSMLTTLYRWYDPDGEVGPDVLAEEISVLLEGILPSLSGADGVRPSRRKASGRSRAGS